MSFRIYVSGLADSFVIRVTQGLVREGWDQCWAFFVTLNRAPGSISKSRNVLSSSSTSIPPCVMTNTSRVSTSSEGGHEVTDIRDNKKRNLQWLFTVPKGSLDGRMYRIHQLDLDEFRSRVTLYFDLTLRLFGAIHVCGLLCRRTPKPGRVVFVWSDNGF